MALDHSSEGLYYPRPCVSDLEVTDHPQTLLPIFSVLQGVSVLPNSASLNLHSSTRHHLEIPQEGQLHLQGLLLRWLCAQSFLRVECGHGIALLAAAVAALNRRALQSRGIETTQFHCRVVLSVGFQPSLVPTKTSTRILCTDVVQWELS